MGGCRKGRDRRNGLGLGEIRGQGGGVTHELNSKCFVQVNPVFKF